MLCHGEPHSRGRHYAANAWVVDCAISFVGDVGESMFFKMTVTESDLHQRTRKSPQFFNDVAENELSVNAGDMLLMLYVIVCPTVVDCPK